MSATDSSSYSIDFDNAPWYFQPLFYLPLPVSLFISEKISNAYDMFAKS